MPLLFLMVVILLYLAEGGGGHRGLRHQWTGRPLQSSVARELHRVTEKCLPGSSSYAFYALNNHGMGSSIGDCLPRAACNALNEGMALRTVSPSPRRSWVWNDVEFCRKQLPPYSIKETSSPLQCYFGGVYSPCSTDNATIVRSKMKNVVWKYFDCPQYLLHNLSTFEVWNVIDAASEYLFSQVNPEVVRLASEEATKIFGTAGSPDAMITVHIRWGDKIAEMGGKLVPIDYYVDAVNYLIRKHGLKNVSIFLTTEDPRAVQSFKNHHTVLGENWTIYEYKASVSRINKKHSPTRDAVVSEGKFGLTSMIVLLLSLESQYYVLATASNWSLLIKSLMSSVVAQTVAVDFVDTRRKRFNWKNRQEYNLALNLSKSYPYDHNGVLAFPIGAQIIQEEHIQPVS